MTKIVGCGRTVAGGYVAYDIAYDAPPAGERVQWCMEIRSSDDAEAIRLVHERVDGRPTAQFVEDSTTGRRTPVDLDADLRDDEITVRFPIDVVGVAVEWPVWKTVVNLDGRDVTSMVVPTH